MVGPTFLLFSSHVLLPAAWEGWLYLCPTSETDPQVLKAQKWRELRPGEDKVGPQWFGKMEDNCSHLSGAIYSTVEMEPGNKMIHSHACVSSPKTFHSQLILAPPAGSSVRTDASSGKEGAEFVLVTYKEGQC